MAKEAAVKDKDQITKEVVKDLVAKADTPVVSKGASPKKIQNAAVKEVGKDHEGKTLVTSTDPDFSGLPWSYDTATMPTKGVNLFNTDGKPYMQIYPDKTALSERDIAALETPYVVVNGMAIVPTRTGLVVNRGEIIQKTGGDAPASKVIGNRFNFSLYGLDDTELSEYVVNVDGKVMTFYLDNKSSVVMDTTKLGISDDYDYYVSRHYQGGATVIVFNSNSLNNLFQGDNQLRNVDISGSVLNASSVHGQSERSGFQYTRKKVRNAFEQVREFKYPRHRHSGLRLRKSSVVDCTLAAGYYSKCSLNSSSTYSDRNLRYSSVMLDNSEIRASSQCLERVNAYDTIITCEAHATVRNVNLNGDRITQRSLLMQNKFNFLKVDLPTDTLCMGRTSATEADIYIFTNTPKRILLSDSREEVEKAVSEVITGRAYRWDEAPPAPDNNPLAQSIIKYATDAVMSRLEMIRILDSATEIVRTVEGRFEDWDDVLDI